MAVSNPATDSVGQTCGVAKVNGDSTGNSVYFAVRTSGPYTNSDGDVIRAGTGAVLTQTMANVPGRIYWLMEDLASNVTHYWGATLSSGTASVNDSFTTDPAPTDSGSGTGIQPPAIPLE